MPNDSTVWRLIGRRADIPPTSRLTDLQNNQSLITGAIRRC
jgi:hypothetical protein